MHRRLFLIALLMSVGCQTNTPSADTVELINVSYDPTRELYEEINKAFVPFYKKEAGKNAIVRQSHGGSGAQARAVIDGLKADVVTLALNSDVDVIARKGLIDEDWQKRLPGNSSPYTSTIVLVVREGNPKNIKDWDDLVKPGVKIITPNPLTSGGARWNFLAAWGFIALHKKGSDAEAEEFVTKLYKNVAKLDTGARSSSQSFVKNKIGDVFISWENEAILSQREAADQRLEIVYPSISILTEPPVTVIDKNVDERGTRAAAEAYLKFLYTDEAQEIIGKNAYRPSNAAILKKHEKLLPPIQLFTAEQVAGSMAQAQQRFFSDDGVFPRIYGKK